MDETLRRRNKQLDYNKLNNITPTQIVKSTESILSQTSVAGSQKKQNYYVEKEGINVAADPVVSYMTMDQLSKAIEKLKKGMEAAVKELDFVEAARCRDEIYQLEQKKTALKP
jgi:excinuclease ABC subunit B